MGDKEVLLTTETKQDKEGKPVVKVTNISKLDLSLSAETLVERQTRLAALIAESKKAMFKFDKEGGCWCAGRGLLLPMCSLWPVRTFLSLILV